MSISPHFFYKTIEYVEEFVVGHYGKQITAMAEIEKKSEDLATPNGKFPNTLQQKQNSHVFASCFVEAFWLSHCDKQQRKCVSFSHLQKILQSFSDDENEHRKQGLESAISASDGINQSIEYPIWKRIVQNGSDYATTLSKLCRGYYWIKYLWFELFGTRNFSIKVTILTSRIWEFKFWISDPDMTRTPQPHHQISEG